MKISYDVYELEYIYNHCGKIDYKNGIIHFPPFMEKRTGKSQLHPELKTLVLPSVHGCCLIFENLHFVIDKN